jgi:hypothetical protein
MPNVERLSYPVIRRGTRLKEEGLEKVLVNLRSHYSSCLVIDVAIVVLSV